MNGPNVSDIVLLEEIVTDLFEAVGRTVPNLRIATKSVPLDKSVTEASDRTIMSQMMIDAAGNRKINIFIEKFKTTGDYRIFLGPKKNYPFKGHALLVPSSFAEEMKHADFDIGRTWSVDYETAKNLPSLYEQMNAPRMTTTRPPLIGTTATRADDINTMITDVIIDAVRTVLSLELRNAMLQTRAEEDLDAVRPPDARQCKIIEFGRT